MYREEFKNVKLNDEKPTKKQFMYNYTLKTENHESNILCGRILTKIMEPHERCSTVVLKLIDLMLSTSRLTVMEGLVYKFLNYRVCKQYGLNEVKEMIIQSNPRQK